LYDICDHFIGTEHFKENISRDISKGKNDILKGYNLSLVKDFDIIHCQVDYLETFMDVFMPKIDKLIVLTTGQWHLPQLHKSDLTERVLNHPQIVLWFSQNPIYEQSEKYIAFPYGLKHHYLNHYCQILRQSSEEKEFDISCLYLGKTHPCRSKFPPSSKKPLPPKEYFTLLKKSKFVISPIGDRDDCYRHYEAIGFGTVPISNVNSKYKSIFGSSMIYETDDTMVKMLSGEVSPPVYTPPNKDLICSSFYDEKIRKLIFQKKYSIR
jgi:hypothetical protein